MTGILHVLTGPTAAGKTDLALRWAARHRAEIVSCDSLLFYRGMDLGTAKPTAAERARIPHHLIDIRDVTERMDVAEYATLARRAAEKIAARGNAVLAVGGSGFYLRSFFAPVADAVTVPAALRAEIAARLATEGLPALAKELAALNPAGLGGLDPANPRRVARALERCLASGKTLPELAADFSRQPAPFAGWDVRCARIHVAPAELADRIVRRTAAMLRDGLVEEVRRLRAAGLEANPSAAKAIGYRETLAMLDGRLSPAALADEIAKNTRHLVKKQLTWFRTQLPPHRVLESGMEDPTGWF